MGAVLGVLVGAVFAAGVGLLACAGVSKIAFAATSADRASKSDLQRMLGVAPRRWFVVEALAGPIELAVALVAGWLIGRPLAAGLVLALGVPFCVAHVQLRRRGVHSGDCGCIRSTRRGEREVSLAGAAWTVLAAGVAAVLLWTRVVPSIDPWTVRALAVAALLAAAVRVWLAGALACRPSGLRPRADVLSALRAQPVFAAMGESVGGLHARPRSFRRSGAQREIVFDAVGGAVRTSVHFDVGWLDCELVVSARVIDGAPGEAPTASRSPRIRSGA